MTKIWNTDDTYGCVAKALHWLIGLAVLAAMGMACVLEEMPKGPAKFELMGIHKATGVTILFLMLARLLWKGLNAGKPGHNPGHKPWEQKLAALVHRAFYAALIIMPLSGWMMSSAANYPFTWFGLFAVPVLSGPNEALAGAMKEVHEICGTVLWVLLALHIGGALKHAIIDRDGSIRRMLPVLALLMLPFTAAAEDAAPPVWTLDRAHSVLSIEATQDGQPFKAVFRAFEGSITLDPAKPETGSGKVLVALGSFDSANKDRDTTVLEPDWFDTAREAAASYFIDRFEHGAADGQLVAKGRLKLRGIERPLDLPFTLRITGDDSLKTARAAGQASLKRLTFGVGQGQWADTKVVGDDVVVHIDITATAKSK